MSIASRKFRRRLAAICSSVIDDAERLAVYESDGLTAKRQLPGLVAIPQTVAEVQALVRLCADFAVPIVARGAGTGLSGGATPLADGLLLSLAKFNRILSVDDEGMTAVVEPGVTNLGVSEAVASKGLYYAPDPSSQIACTLGGNVAENSGGVHCLKYGLTLHNVLALKVVLADGSLVAIGSGALDSPGLDLLALMHGSEGMLGIVVEVTVKLLPKPAHTQVLMAAFEEVADAAQAVSAIIGSGLVPAGLELMDGPAIQAAEAYAQAGYPVAAGALLLLELDGGTKDEVHQAAEAVQALLGTAQSMTWAESAADRQRLWAGRKAAFPAVGRLAPDYYCMDGTIPRRELPGVLARISELSTQYGLRVANVFHAGDGNLHPLILYDANNEDELQRAEQFGSDILQLCIAKGGTITGEHGVGVEKINEMCVQFSPSELTLFHGVKAAFDPKGLLNPGKAVPTLSRCAEFGAMHVHSGEEPFPHLERF